MHAVSAWELVTLANEMQLLGALDTMASLSRPLCIIHIIVFHEFLFIAIAEYSHAALVA